MKKLIFAIALVMAFSGAAFAAVDCNTVGFCKYHGQVVFRHGTFLDCSTRECVMMFGLSDTPDELVNITVFASNGLRCQQPYARLQARATCADPDFGCAKLLYFTDDPPPGIEYSLAVFFEGCEENGRCGGFITGDPNPDCDSAEGKNFTAMPVSLPEDRNLRRVPGEQGMNVTVMPVSLPSLIK